MLVEGKFNREKERERREKTDQRKPQEKHRVEKYKVYFPTYETDRFSKTRAWC